jgi:drug/metabolite transporter (DMT)-like permease
VVVLPGGVLAGLAAALCLGVADFCVQRVTQRTGWLKGLAWSQLLGVPVMVGAALAIEGSPETDWAVWWPVLALGVVNTFGSTALYRAFERGLLSIVSPIASTCGAVTVLIALSFGRGPGLWLGLASLVLIVGVVLVSAVRDDPSAHKNPDEQRSGISWAAVSALVFGAVFYALESAGAAVGPVWTVAGLRVVAVPLLWSALAWERRGEVDDRDGWMPGPVGLALVGAVVLDGSGLVAYTMGTQGGQISVVAVLTSMFSAVTVLLAQRYLSEELSKRQWTGLVMTLLGVGGVVALGG